LYGVEPAAAPNETGAVHELDGLVDVYCRHLPGALMKLRVLTCVMCPESSPKN
jgi:hypothetical protein